MNSFIVAFTPKVVRQNVKRTRTIISLQQGGWIGFVFDVIDQIPTAQYYCLSMNSTLLIFLGLLF